MEYRSFCILNETLYLCTSDICNLLSILTSKGLDSAKADQGRIYHTSPEDFLVICSLSTEKLVRENLLEILKGNLHFKGANIPPKNNKIKKIDVIVIQHCYTQADYPYLVKEIKCNGNKS